MSGRTAGRMPPWLAFVLGGFVAAVAVVALSMYGGARPLPPRPFALNLALPRTPSLPETPRLPPPPLPIAK
jgi:hypothetical protein